LKIRRPTQAGAFYAGSQQSLREQIESCFRHELGPGSLPTVADKKLQNIVGLVCPHAGYMYSGPVAAHGYYHLAQDGKPDIVVILGPNHTGNGSALAAMREGAWRTPLGDVEIDTATADLITHASSIIDVDDSAHAFEHSVEVQLPFLQYLYGSSFKFVPICFLMQDLESSREVGSALAKALIGKNAVIIASTDMTHYEPLRSTEKKDKAAIEAVLKLDEQQLYSTVEGFNISMCGPGPTTALVAAAKALGAKKAELLCYKTSGDITGDYSAVVGYASIAFMKS
jgi:AmmeMemoRadiSam system protein B